MSEAGVPSLLTPADVAARLAVNVRTVRRLARSGELPSVAVCSALRFTEEDVAAFVARHRRAGPEDAAPLRHAGRRLEATTYRS